MGIFAPLAPQVWGEWQESWESPPVLGDLGGIDFLLTPLAPQVWGEWEES